LKEELLEKKRRLEEAIRAETHLLLSSPRVVVDVVRYIVAQEQWQRVAEEAICPVRQDNV